MFEACSQVTQMPKTRIRNQNQRVKTSKLDVGPTAGTGNLHRLGAPCRRDSQPGAHSFERNCSSFSSSFERNFSSSSSSSFSKEEEEEEKFCRAAVNAIPMTICVLPFFSRAAWFRLP